MDQLLSTASSSAPPATFIELRESCRLGRRHLKGGRLEVAKFVLAHPYDVASPSPVSEEMPCQIDTTAPTVNNPNAANIDQM